MTTKSNAIGRRIFREHVRLIAVIVVVGACVGFLARATAATTYTGSARLALDTADPQTPTEAQTNADMAAAIATSRAVVHAAIERAGVDRNAVDVARKHVSVVPLGTSAVLELSVTDTDRRVAAALANALAQQVIDTRVAFSEGRLQEVLTRLQAKIDDLNTRIATLDAQADSLAARIAGATSARAVALRAQRNAALQSRDLLVQQRSVAESERVSLLATDAARPDARIISRATTTQTPPHRLSGAVLGAFLGLIIAIGLAAAIETARPTVAGSQNLAEALGAPLIGVIRSAYPGQERIDGDELSLLRTRLRLAREAAGGSTIGLIAADRSVDLTELAARLAGTPADTGVADGAEPARRTAPGDVDVHVATLDRPTVNGRRGGGIVVVSPTALKRSQLAGLEHELRSVPRALMGVITYKAPQMRRWPQSNVQDRVPVVESA